MRKAAFVFVSEQKSDFVWSAMDRRQQKTREAIFQAFNRLLARKKYSRITVQNIIDEANVGRSTFYSHFTEKDALLKEMCTEMFEHVFSNHSRSETTHDFSSRADNAESFITHILYHLRDNKKIITGILHSEGATLFMRAFNQYLGGFFVEKLNAGKNLPPVPTDFLLHHLTCSFEGLLRWWIQNNMKQSPEEMESYFLAVVKPALDFSRQ